MKQQIKLTESELKMVIEGAVRNLLKEYDPHMAGRGAARGLERGNIKPWNAAQKIARRDGWDEDQLMAFQNGFERKPVQQSGSELEEEDFNEQPTNDVVGENKRPLKITENQLFSIIKESVNKILNEIGDKHRFGQGKYGLAMDAASKARSLGRKEQAANLERHGADAFNKQYGTTDFEMDDYGQLRHKGADGKERMYRPKSKLDILNKTSTSDGRYDNAMSNNAYIRNSASTAKAFPRKKMTGGLDAIDAVDNGIHGNI